MTSLYCNCNYKDKIAEYNDKEVKIKCKHGKIFILRIVDGKLQQVFLN